MTLTFGKVFDGTSRSPFSRFSDAIKQDGIANICHTRSETPQIRGSNIIHFKLYNHINLWICLYGYIIAYVEKYTNIKKPHRYPNITNFI